MKDTKVRTMKLSLKYKHLSAEKWGSVCWSWVVGRGSQVVGRGSQVVGRGSQVVGREFQVVGRGLLIGRDLH